MPYHFKIKCGNCGELSQKETCVILSEVVPLPRGRGTTHLVQKCKLCEREGTVLMIPGKGRPLTLYASETRNYSPLMLFDCSGFEPVDFVFRDGWKAESVESGTNFEDINLSKGEYDAYDEDQWPVRITYLRSDFIVVK